MAVLRKAVLTKKLEALGVFKARDGRILMDLRPDELEDELAFALSGKEGTT